MYQICLVGEAAVGKTSYITRLKKKTYDSKYIPTKSTTVEFCKIGLDDGKTVVVQFTETLESTNCSGIIYFYDLLRPETGMTESTLTNFGQVPYVVIGNKIDRIASYNVRHLKGYKISVRCNYQLLDPLEELLSKILQSPVKIASVN